MKKLYLFPIFCFCFLFGNAQNLVKNPGFEARYNCPFGQGELFECQNWFNPTMSSPDYFHLCSPINLVPTNIWGYQFPHTDSAYAGFYSYGTGNINIREYIEGELIQPLDSGKKYCFEMYLSLCDICQVSAGPIGVYFSDTLVYLPLDSASGWYIHYLPFSPQLEFTAVTDTAGWVLVQDTFIATGNERYLIIGNFRTGVNTVIDTLFPIIAGYGSYYYVDDVSVTFCDTIQPPPPPPPVEPVSQLAAFNAFSPNGDGVNDVFTVTYKDIKTYRLQIFNRWGNLIFETDNPEQGWDGRYNGDEVPEGTYYYLIDATGLDEKRYLMKGFVTLVR